MQSRNFDLLSFKGLQIVITTMNQAEDYDRAIQTENYMLQRISGSKSPVDASIKGLAYGLRASTHTSLGETDQALSDYKNAVKFNPQDSGWYDYQAGEILRRKKRYQEAIPLFDKSIAAKCVDPLVEKSKGICLVALGHETEAIKYFNIALTKITTLRKTFPEANTPDLLYCYKALAACYAHDKRLAESKDMQQKYDALTAAWQDTLLDNKSGTKSNTDSKSEKHK